MNAAAGLSRPISQVMPAVMIFVITKSFDLLQDHVLDVAELLEQHLPQARRRPGWR